MPAEIRLAKIKCWNTDNSAIVSIGSPLYPNWFARYSSVQEQSVALGGTNNNGGMDVCPSYTSTKPNGTYQFTKFACPAGGGFHLDDYSTASYGGLNVQECEFWGGTNVLGGTSGTTLLLDNNLFARSCIGAAGSGSLFFSNNLVWGTASVRLNPAGGTVWYAFNNAFDSTTIAMSILTNGYNAYLNSSGRLYPTNPHDIVSSITLAYKSGWLGTFYQPTTSLLINMGGTTADLAGLYEFTTQTNQVKETNSTVDIGYHYVATDAHGNPLETLWLGVPDYLADTNGGLVAWEMEYFGHTGLDPAALDASGNTLLTDYQNYLNGTPTDPNVIQFTVETTNNYVSAANAGVQLNITVGVPGKYAVSVDDTNYAADASWTNYVSTNITVNLGSTQGWHDVWIALKGPATNATVTWEWKHLKLDTTAPQLVITSPTNGTVNVPMIQVTGYSAMALGSISYDLTNALGLVTNQQVLVLNQTYSTNTWEFTTNTFQAFDVPLTNGVNTFTFHATDLAGNVTTLTTNITLNYAGVTNPVIQLFWPRNGEQISGSNFTWRGWVDDPTATIVASIMDTNGNTTVVPGYTERNGNFWVENLPMPSGTNSLTLAVTNSAGYGSTTNIFVSTNPLTVTMTPVPDDQLWNLTVTATGSISDSTYSLWINEVKAGVTNGVWTANNVPMTPGGVAIFNITTYAPGETQPDNSHGN